MSMNRQVSLPSPSPAETLMLDAYDIFDRILRNQGAAVAHQAAKAVFDAVREFEPQRGRSPRAKPTDNSAADATANATDA